jgi:hypothetical protein
MFALGQDMPNDQEVSSGNFAIQPAYFHLTYGGSVSLKVTFRPSFPGTAVDKFYVLCSNMTVRSFNVIGDGAYVERMKFHFAVLFHHSL